MTSAKASSASSSTALVLVHDVPAALLSENSGLTGSPLYELAYLESYDGPAISLTLPVRSEPYEFERFPPFFDGLLPEGLQLEGLLRQAKIDRHDYFAQLLAVGADLVGAVTVCEERQAAERGSRGAR